MNNNIGINSEKLQKLILNIYEYRDKISKSLEDLEELIESTKKFYNSTDGDEFREKFSIFSNNFPIFLDNIKSYGTDLEYVLSSYKKINVESVDIFQNK